MTSDDIDLERADREPVVLVPCHAYEVAPGKCLVGWLCWDAPGWEQSLKRCSMAHSELTDEEIVCTNCGKVYGVFVNKSAPFGAVVVTMR